MAFWICSIFSLLPLHQGSLQVIGSANSVSVRPMDSTFWSTWVNNPECYGHRFWSNSTIPEFDHDNTSVFFAKSGFVWCLDTLNPMVWHNFPMESCHFFASRAGLRSRPVPRTAVVAAGGSFRRRPAAILKRFSWCLPSGINWDFNSYGKWPFIVDLPTKDVWIMGKYWVTLW